MNNQKYIVLLSTAQWDNPFWTNKQYVALELAKMGYKVFYIDSLGLRRPSASSQDIKRVFKRFKKAFAKPKEVRENLWVWSPILLPFQSKVWVRRVNYILLNRWLNFWINRLNFKKDIFWTYNPITTKLFNTKEYKQLIYHCVDEIKAQPGMPVKILEEAEEELAKEADIIFVTSKKLYQTRKVYNSQTYYFSNVADYTHFAKAQDSKTVVPQELKEIPKPIIGFIGAISGYKVDFKLLEFLAKRHKEYSFVLIGKVGEGDPWTKIDNLEKLNNIYFLGPKPYEELPNYLKGIDVAILPNNINEYTNSMFPMKFFEYLAASKPVVSVDLSALYEFKDIVYLSKDYEEFSKNLQITLKDINYNLEDRLIVAKEFTYSERMKKMMQIVQKGNN